MLAWFLCIAGVYLVGAVPSELAYAQAALLACVSPPRAVLDCASLLDDLYELEALVADAAYRRLAFGEELRGQVERNAGRPGVAPLRRVLDLEGGPRLTRSKGERWFLQLLREHRITGYEVNEKIHGKEVDFLWRDQSFCVSHGEWSLALPRNGLSQRPFPARQA